MSTQRNSTANVDLYLFIFKAAQRIYIKLVGISKEGLLRPSDCVKNIHDGKEVNSFSLSNFTACLTRIKRKEQHIEYFLRTN